MKFKLLFLVIVILCSSCVSRVKREYVVFGNSKVQISEEEEIIWFWEHKLYHPFDY